MINVAMVTSTVLFLLCTASRLDELFVDSSATSLSEDSSVDLIGMVSETPPPLIIIFHPGAPLYSTALVPPPRLAAVSLISCSIPSQVSLPRSMRGCGPP